MLGELAKTRERNIIEEFSLEKDWRIQAFTPQMVVKALYNEPQITDEIIEAYKVACRDLRIQGLLKQVSGYGRGERYMMTDEVANYRE